MTRTINDLNLHHPLIYWLFFGLETALLFYQIFRFYAATEQQKNWVPIFILLLLLIWNCTAGYLAELLVLVLVNTATLTVTVLVMLLPFLYGLPKTGVRKSGAPEAPGSPEEPIDCFMENCRQHQLTPRETEIVLLIRKGYKNRRIAGELYISEKTVESHLQHIYDKTGQRSKLTLINRLNR